MLIANALARDLDKELNNDFYVPQFSSSEPSPQLSMPSQRIEAGRHIPDVRHFTGRSGGHSLLTDKRKQKNNTIISCVSRSYELIPTYTNWASLENTGLCTAVEESVCGAQCTLWHCLRNFMAYIIRELHCPGCFWLISGLAEFTRKLLDSASHRNLS